MRLRVMLHDMSFSAASRIGLAAGAFAFVAAQAPASEGIHWMTDLAAAKKVAKRLHKPIFIDFYADW